jgi:N-acetylglucosamine-6-phosphate deacetylase
MGLHVLRNACFFTEGGFDYGDIAWTDEGEFVDPGRIRGEQLDENSSAEGCLVIPGLCDIHLHGACGEDMSDGRPEGLRKMAIWEASHGTAEFCPATMTIGRDDIVHAMASARSFHDEASAAGWRDAAGKPMARMAGVYMEGPFISREKCGAQDPRHVMSPSLEFLDEADRASGGLVRFAVIAPEEPGAEKFASGASERKIRPCVGHTACSFDEAAAAFRAGAVELTHAFNAMPPMLHRAPGPIPAAVLSGASAELIADGIHIANPMIAMAFRMFGAERMILISDSMRAAGLDDGTYTLGGQEVLVRGREARLRDGTLAGSVSCLFDCMRNAVLNAKVPLHDAVVAAAVNPRRAAGLDFEFAKPGSEASFIVLTRPANGLRIMRIVIGGADAQVAPALQA